MNFIYTKTNSISDITCKAMISTFEQAKNKEKLREIESVHFGSDLFRWRTFDSVLYKELSVCLQDYIASHKEDTDIFNNVNIKDNGFFIQKLIKNRGNVEFHNDFFTQNSTTRILTYIWFLNDIDNGGELVFWNNKEKIKPKQGTIVIFPSNWTFSYKHTHPIEQDQYIVIGGVYTYV